jgi:aldose 1-epimerase
MISISNRANTLRAMLVPEAGASIASFDGLQGSTWLPLMRHTPVADLAQLNVSMMASFNLVPWSNRVVGAAFTFRGQRYSLQANTPQGFAIHGDAIRREWRITEQTDQSVTCALDSRDFADFNYPFPFTATIKYVLSDAAFDTHFTLTNQHTDAIPAGFGFHPYFMRSLSSAHPDEVMVQFRARGVYPPLPGMLAPPVETAVVPEFDPLRELPHNMNFTDPSSIGERFIDHCYGGWDGRAAIIYPTTGVRLDFECDASLRHVILYTPPGRDFFALEPVTHANDALNMHSAGVAGTGLRILHPGEHLTGTFRIHTTTH